MILKKLNFERTMRAQRQEIDLLKKGNADEDDIIAARCRYRVTSQEYKRFSEAMVLPEQRQRVTVDGLGNIGQGKWKRTLTKINESDKINNSKLTNIKRRASLPPKMDEGRYHKMVNGFKRQGVTVLEAKGDDLRYLDSLGAEASIGGTTHIFHRGEIPSASAMFEEIIHITKLKNMEFLILLNLLNYIYEKYVQTESY